jgi:hypothetical protein
MLAPPQIPAALQRKPCQGVDGRPPHESSPPLSSDTEPGAEEQTTEHHSSERDEKQRVNTVAADLDRAKLRQHRGEVPARCDITDRVEPEAPQGYDDESDAGHNHRPHRSNEHSTDPAPAKPAHQSKRQSCGEKGWPERERPERPDRIEVGDGLLGIGNRCARGAGTGDQRPTFRRPLSRPDEMLRARRERTPIATREWA